jgi:hypothetical protein
LGRVKQQAAGCTLQTTHRYFSKPSFNYSISLKSSYAESLDSSSAIEPEMISSLAWVLR